MELVAQVYVAGDDGCVFGAVCPRFVVTGEGVFEVAGAVAVAAHEGEEGGPLLPADVEFAVLGGVDVAAPWDG